MARKSEPNASWRLAAALACTGNGRGFAWRLCRASRKVRETLSSRNGRVALKDSSPDFSALGVALAGVLRHAGTPALVRWFWQYRRAAGSAPELPARGIVFLLTEPALAHTTEPYWKDSRPRRASRRGLDGPAAARLWAQSERMCGMA